MTDKHPFGNPLGQIPPTPAIEPELPPLPKDRALKFGHTDADMIAYARAAIAAHVARESTPYAWAEENGGFTLDAEHARRANERGCKYRPLVWGNVGAPANEDVLKFGIEVEKLLCEKLGRPWSAAGISIESLVNELAARAPAASTPAAGGEVAGQAVEPMFWVRLCSDNTYEGPIHNNSIEPVRKTSGAWSPLFVGGATAQVVEPAGWRAALEFYAQRSHFAIADDDAWDTVSGEPQNFWCDEASTATVEDGTVAAMALAGTPLPDEDDEAAASPAPVGEVAAALGVLPAGFFAYGSDNGFEFMATAKEAEDYAREELKYATEAAKFDGEWPPEVDQICWGAIFQRATDVSTDEEFSDYQLRDGAASPAPAGGQSELEAAHEARKQAQANEERAKDSLARARIDLMRELREQGWQAPAGGQSQGAVACAEQCWACAESGIGCNLVAPASPAEPSEPNPDCPNAFICAGRCGNRCAEVMDAAPAPVAGTREEPAAATGQDAAIYQSIADNYFTHEPALCIKPACPANCCGCNRAISSQQQRDYAIRYAFLRSQPLDAIHAGGVFIGRTPENQVLNEEDADEAIDAMLAARPAGEEGEGS